MRHGLWLSPWVFYICLFLCLWTSIPPKTTPVSICTSSNNNKYHEYKTFGACAPIPVTFEDQCCKSSCVIMYWDEINTEPHFCLVNQRHRLSNCNLSIGLREDGLVSNGLCIQKRIPYSVETLQILHLPWSRDLNPGNIYHFYRYFSCFYNFWLRDLYSVFPVNKYHTPDSSSRRSGPLHK